jgi:hypothetical protein
MKMSERTLHETRGVRAEIGSEDAVSWKELGKIEWEQSNGQLTMVYLALTGWTFESAVRHKDSSWSEQWMAFTASVPGCSLECTWVWFETILKASGLGHRRELSAKPVFVSADDLDVKVFRFLVFLLLSKPLGR